MTTNLPLATEAKILIKAKEIIEQFGWTQGTYGAEHVGFCLSGAVLKYEALPETEWTAFALLASVLPPDDENIDPEGRVIAWNDREVRTKEEVLDALDKAIALGMGLP